VLIHITIQFCYLLAVVAPDYVPERTDTLQLKLWHVNVSTAFLKIKKNSRKLDLTLVSTGW